MSTTQQPIREATQHGQSFTVDESNPDFVIVRGVRVLNRTSRNGGIYEAKAIESAAKLSNRLPLSLEHTSEEGRRYVDRVGQLRDGRVIEGGKAVEADAWINRGDKLADKIRIDAKHFPENINLSVELPADGWIGEDSRRVDGKYRVRDITRMVDCSIVAEGGTTSTLYESYRPDGDNNMSQPATTDVKETVKAVLSEEKSAAAAIAERAAFDKQIEELRAANEKLQGELKEMRDAEARRVRIAAIIAQAKELGAGEITEEYAKTLAALDEASTKAIFEREASLAKQQADTPRHVQAPSVGAVVETSNKSWSWVDSLK